MAKTVFRPNEIKKSDDRVVLELPRRFVVEAPVEEVEEAPVYEGPTVDDIRREAERYRADFELEKEDMANQARAEAERIVKDAEKAAFDEVKRKTDQAQVIRQEFAEFVVVVDDGEAIGQHGAVFC